MSDVKLKALKILKKNVNLGGLAADIIDEALEPALDKIVADTANPVDDAIKAMIYPPLEKFLKEEIEKAVNKLFAAADESAEN